VTALCQIACALSAVPRRDAIVAYKFIGRSLGFANEFAATIALRTQQIIAHETGVTKHRRPLGGSYFVESLTNEVELRLGLHPQNRCHGRHGRGHRTQLPAARNCGSFLPLSNGIGQERKIMVGVNDFVSAEKALDILQIDETVATRQAVRLRKSAPNGHNPKLTALSPRSAKPPKARNLMPSIYAR